MTNAPARRRVLSDCIKFGVTLALLAFLLTRVDLHTTGAQVAAVGMQTASACIGAILVLSLLVSWRWKLILRRMEAQLDYTECWRLVMIGLFFNQTLPSGIGGDALRVWLVGRAGLRLRVGFISVAADRMFALLAVLICMVITLPTLLRGPAAMPVAVLTTAGVCGFLVLFGFDAVHDFEGRFRLTSGGYRLPGLLERGADLARDLSRVMLLVLKDPGTGVLVLLLSVINQVALGTVVFLIAHALGADIGLGRTVILFTPAMLLSMVPISFGGWGVREAAMMWLFSGAGLSSSTALSISVVFGLVTTAAGLPGGVFWLVDWLRPAHVEPSAASLSSSNDGVPRILAARTRVVSPWMSVVERKVNFGNGRIELYHALRQADYVGILAITPDGLIPIVRQYRPALERFTWELPAGMVDPGESAVDTCRRELLEETGLVASRIHPIGVHAADSARLDNMIHSFLVETEANGNVVFPEPGLEIAFVSWDRLLAMITSSEFDLQYHIAVVALILIRPDLASLITGPEHATRFRVRRLDPDQ